MTTENSAGTDHTIITAARMFDGTGSAPVEGRAVLLSDGKIAAIGPVAEMSAPDNSNVTVRDSGDATLLPGPVPYTHLTMPTTLLASQRGPHAYFLYTVITNDAGR